MEFLFGEIANWLDHGFSDTEINLESLSNDSQEAPKLVALKALGYLAEIRVKLQQSDEKTPEDLISISLQDMKLVSKLVKLVVFCGIAPNMDFDLPSKWSVPHSNDPEALGQVLEKLYEIMSTKDDLSDVVSMTQFEPWLLAGAAKDSSLDKFVALLPTFQLYQTFMMLLSYPQTPEPLKVIFSGRLSRLPFDRKDAVRSMIDLFSGYRQSESIQVERLAPMIQIFSHPPSGIDYDEYIKVIDQQLFQILASTRTPLDINAATSYLVDILQKNAPQTLRYFIQSLTTPFREADHDLADAMMALTSLVDKTRATPIVLEATREIFPLIWLVFERLCANKAPNGSVLKLLTGLIRLEPDFLDVLIDKLLISNYNGLTPLVSTGSALYGPKVKLFEYVSPQDNMDFGLIDERIDILSTILTRVEDIHLTNLFIKLLRNSLDTSQHWMDKLLRLKLLQVLVEDFKSRLFTHPQELIEMCLSVVGVAVKHQNTQKLEVKEEPVDSDDEDEDEEDSNKVESELVEICVDLLTGVMLETLEDDKITTVIAGRRDVLEELAKGTRSEALNVKILYCLKVVDSIKGDGPLDLGDDHINYGDSAEVLKAARSALQDSLVPIRAQGLQLLRQLVQRKEIEAGEALDLALVQLKDEDSFLYLNAIKTIEQCASTFGANTLLPKLVQLYGDPQGDLDVQLRIGEAIVRLVELSARAFSANNTIALVDALVAKVRVQNDHDNRLRMSSMSIMGWLVAQNALGLHQQQTNILDCCLGILRMESDPMMVRSALVVLLEAVNHVNEGTLKLSSVDVSQVRTQLGVCADSPDEIISSYAKDILAIM